MKELKEWSALKKQPDKAKKMLSALHMSPAYLKVSWSELDEGDQKKISNWIAKNGSGWFEKGEPTSTPKGIKNVAPKHRKAAIKRESAGVLRKPMKKEKSVRTVNKEETPQTHKEEKASLEEMVKELKKIYKKFKGAVRGTPEHNFLLMREGQLNDAIRDIYLERIEKIPESKKIKPDGLGILALAGRAASKAVQESPLKVNLETMISEWVKGQDKKEPTKIPKEEKEKELDIKCPECGHNLVEASKEYSEAVRGAVKEGTPICRLHGTLENIEQHTGKLVSPHDESIKQPWEMTQKEYVDMRTEKAGAFDFEFPKFHKSHVEEALAAGTIIPEEVLKDYPELTKKKSSTLIYLEGAYKSQLESLSSEPIPLSNPEVEEITDAIEFAKKIMVTIIMHFDKVDVQMRYWRNTEGAPTSLEIIVFNESMNPVYHNKDYDMNLTAAEVFRIRDSETNRIIESEKEERKKKEKEEEQRKNRFNKTTLSIYNKTYPMAMDYFLYSIVTLPPTVGVDNMTEEWLEKINRHVAEAGDNKYPVEWFKERNEYLVKEEWEKTSKKEPEKPEKYYKITSVDGKYKKVKIKTPYPFSYKGINFVSHFESSQWHTTEVSTGLMFTSGKTKDESENAATAIVDKHGADWVMKEIEDAKQGLEETIKKAGGN